MATLKFEQVSDKLIKIIDTLLSSQKLCKFLHYTGESPLDQLDLDAQTCGSLLFNKVFPFPFDELPATKEDIQLRVFYPKFNLKSRVLEDTKLQIDIILPKTKQFWMTIVDGNHKIRPFEIMVEILSLLHEKDIGIGFKLNFLDGRVINTTQQFNQLTLQAEMLNVSSGGR